MTDSGHGWAEVKRELLAIIELPPDAARERLRALAEERPALAAEVETLWRREVAEQEPFLAVPALARVTEEAPPPPSAPARVGPWRLETEIGHGGMGTVWRARRDDGAFEQVVAVKLVRPEMASDLLRRRLVAERRILAGLHHPGIARLLDGGVTAEGQPYLVLEYVDGERIDVWCDRRALSMVERLRLFLQVCSAVELAHRQLVLHRDLKASNVMVDERGQPKLLDFGIAKLLGPEAADPEQALTLALERPLTPEWASPEQLRGEPLSTASDVYSLGVLLCLLLTGERPHRWSGQSPVELARIIEESGGGPLTGLLRRRAAPGVEMRSLRGDLERVLGRALAPEPERRYGSVAELAADLERFLDGRPVSAHPRSITYRARKFVRRHRAAVAATAIVVVSLLAATVVSVRQARIARWERQRAERRFDEVRQLATRFLFEFEEMIRDLPGATPARERLASTARDSLDRLAAEAGDNPALLAELVQAYLKVGDLQGHPSISNLGHAQQARASYERARSLALRALALDPHALPMRVRVATAELRLGDLAMDAGDAARADSRYAAGLAAIEAVLTEAPKDGEARRVLGQALQRLGTVRLNRGKTAEAVALFARARDAAAALLAERPHSLEAQRDLLVALIYLGDGWDAADEPARALPPFEEALRLAEARRTAQPGFESGRDWSVVLQRLLIANRRLGRHQEELVLAQKANDWAQQAAAADPANTLLRRDVAEGLIDLCRAQGAVGKSVEALASCTAGRRRFEEQARAEPGSAQVRRYAASSLYSEAEALAAVGRHEEARAAVDRARHLQESIIASQPDDSEVPDELAESLQLGARLELQRGQAAAALADLARALELEAKLAPDADQGSRSMDRAALLFWRGEARAMTGDRAAACIDYRQAAALSASAPAQLESPALPLGRLRAVAARCPAEAG